MLSMIGLVGGLLLLITLTMRGMNLLIATPVSALWVAAFSGLPLLPQLSHTTQTDFLSSYMEGFSAFTASWLMMFLLGAMFGKLMEDSGAADSIAAWIIKRIGMQNGALAIVIACAVLTYGGVSLFVVAFSVYPMAVSLFREANLPRRFIPAALAFGSTTFTMTSAGSPEIQNWIPIKYLHTSPYAGWQVSLAVAVFMMIFGYWWLKRMIVKAVRKGEGFMPRGSDPPPAGNRKLPNPYISLIPLLVVLLACFFLHGLLAQYALIIALLGGVIATALLHWGSFLNFGKAVSDAVTGSLVALANTAAVVGFGSVVKKTPAFAAAVEQMINIPGNPLVGSAIAVCVIAGITGSASGGQSIALPLLAPHYLAMGVNPEALHRITAIASGSLDHLPHGGYAVTTIRAIAGETHKDAYPAFGAVTVVVAALGVVLAIILFTATGTIF